MEKNKKLLTRLSHTISDIPELFTKLINLQDQVLRHLDAYDRKKYHEIKAKLNFKCLPNIKYPNKFYTTVISYTYKEQNVQFYIDNIFQTYMSQQRLDKIFDAVIKKNMYVNPDEKLVKLKLQIKKHFARMQPKPKQEELNNLEEPFKYLTCCICLEPTAMLIPLATLCSPQHTDNVCKGCYDKMNLEKTIIHKDGVSSQKLNNAKCPICRKPFENKSLQNTQEKK